MLDQRSKTYARTLRLNETVKLHAKTLLFLFVPIREIT